jgi:hypothetical protein
VKKIRFDVLETVALPSIGVAPAANIFDIKNSEDESIVKKSTINITGLIRTAFFFMVTLV